MRPYRLRRLAKACRLSAPVTSFVVLAALVSIAGRPASLYAAETVRGTIVDQSGRAIPRAYVRPLDRANAPAGGVFADEAGRFELTVATTTTGCQIEITLTGFEPATAPCSAAPLRVVLAIAAIRETVLVSATRTDAPSSQVGASATVFTADDLERRQTPLLADLG